MKELEPDISHYETNVHKLLESRNQTLSTKALWKERILFLSATLFGILVSLHTSTEHSLCARLCFVLACVSLALGILLLGIASYSHISARVLTENDLSEEIQSAMKECRRVKIAQAKPLRIFAVCDTCAYIFLLFSVLLLALYLILTVIP